MLSSDLLPATRQKRSRKYRIVRAVLVVFGTVSLIAGGVVYWALNRYVIDHVVISDVAAYEAQVRGDTTTTVVDIVGTTAVTTGATIGAATVSTAGTTYTSDDTSISISEVVVGSGTQQITYYVADVLVDDATQLRGGFAENKFGDNIVADTSEIAEYYDAVFAINGDYYGYRRSGIVIRNGVLFRDDGARTGLAMYSDGHWEIYDEETTTGEKLIADGVWNTVSFGPALLDDGEIVEGIEDMEVDTNIGNHSIQGNQPRTGLGIIDDNHYVFVVVDGRSSGYSRGVTMTEFAQIFEDLGATVAYNLDGGGSSTMYFNGELISNPLGKNDERPTSDILYVA